jgi:hypothetical protein
MRAARNLRWWLRTSGVFAVAAGAACILLTQATLAGAVLGIALMVYGISALSTVIG